TALRRPRAVVMNSLSVFALGMRSKAGEHLLAPGSLDHRAEVAGMPGSKVLPIAGDQELESGIAAEHPGSEPDRGADRLQMPRRHGDEEAPDATFGHLLELPADDLNVRGRNEGLVLMKGLERLAYEGVEIAAQELGEHLILGLFVAHIEPPSSSTLSVPTSSVLSLCSSMTRSLKRSRMARSPAVRGSRLLSGMDAISSPVPRTPGIFSNWSLA